MRLFLLASLLLLGSSLPGRALELTAVSPSTAFPGSSVTLAGGPFTSNVMVLVGDQRVAASDFSPTRLTFSIPRIPAGDYSLALEREGTRVGGPFILHVVQPPPRIRNLDPVAIDTCNSSGSSQVTVSGSNFLTGATLLFDNAALAVNKLGESEIVFTLPVIKSGLHQVQVVNPDTQRSLPHTLIINSIPEIEVVQIGEERTVEYELILRGKNFVHGSRVIVSGADVDRDAQSFVDCTTLNYIRRPFIREARELSLQVINPGGDQSNIYHITAP